jgi:hypothetical protein
MKRRLIMFLFLLVLTANLSLTASAVVMPIGLSAERVSDEKAQAYMSSTKPKVGYDEHTDLAVSCFAVSESGLIAVGFDTAPRSVNIYRSDGTFIQRFDFHCDGSYGIAWEGSDLAIYFSRSDLVEMYTLDGQGIGAYKVLRTEENNKRTRELLYPKETTVGNITYQLERDVGLSLRSYSRLTATDIDGNVVVIYDSTGVHNIGTICLLLCIAVPFVLAIQRLFGEENKA